MRKWMIAVVPLLLVGCSQTQPVVTPQPTVTVTQPAPEETTDDVVSSDTKMVVMDLVWDEYSQSERETMCGGYRYAPGLMWNAFDSEQTLDYQITKEQFMSFFDEKCGA